MKRLFFTSVFILLAGFVFSQTLIPKAGVTLSKWVGDNDGNVTLKLGFTTGFALNFPVGTGPISMQPELNFIQKGLKMKKMDQVQK